YKMIFLCKAISNKINKGFDVLDVQFFDINNLPPLSEERILKTQIELLYNKITLADFDVYVD
ncbi:MAG: ADP-ribose pyrophosphatase, partial [Ferruginibacter sp.]